MPSCVTPITVETFVVFSFSINRLIASCNRSQLTRSTVRTAAAAGLPSLCTAYSLVIAISSCIETSTMAYVAVHTNRFVPHSIQLTD